MPARTLTLLGSSSSVGKSLLVTALCRIFVRRGVRVAPFKAQNMSNNAAVCADGAEIGRAQALQAAAARLEPTPDMNPVLLKPEADARAQVIVQGRPWQTLTAGGYFERKQALWPVVTAALDRLRTQFELVIIEGAGSPVELNLRGGDIVNMAVARHAASPVLLVGDIDRGGIFAQLLGTLWLLERDERRQVRGLVVNKFRGDRRLFADGVRILQERAELPVLGVVPYTHGLGLPEEDAVALDDKAQELPSVGLVDVAIIRLPRIANFDDFDRLAGEPALHVRYVSSTGDLGTPAAVIVPGTKSTMADLAWLRRSGLAEAIVRLARTGTAVVGICGGYQMLGRSVHDPDGVESDERTIEGLGLLDVETTFASAKQTRCVQARVLATAPAWMEQGSLLDGYEIHMGRTQTLAPWLESQSGRDGASSGDGRVWGCYLHGIFANDGFRRAWLRSLGWTGMAGSQRSDVQERSLDRLADAVAGALDLQALDRIIEGES